MWVAMVATQETPGQVARVAHSQLAPPDSFQLEK
jgi:hypothetical protein